MPITNTTQAPARIRNPFGAAKPEAAAPEAVKTTFWLNVGFQTDVIDETTGKNVFIAMPGGVPLEAIKPKPIRGQGDFADMLAAGNSLLEQIMAVCAELEPGEARLVDLQVEVRRVKAEAVASAPEANKFMRQLTVG